MNLRDLDFSKRLPVNFQRSVEIPLFPQLRKSNIRSKSTNCNESSGYNPKRESTTLLKNDSVMKSPQNSKFSAWTEIVIPFSRSLKPRSYHSMVFYDKR